MNQMEIHIQRLAQNIVPYISQAVTNSQIPVQMQQQVIGSMTANAYAVANTIMNQLPHVASGNFNTAEIFPILQSIAVNVCNQIITRNNQINQPVQQNQFGFGNQGWPQPGGWNPGVQPFNNMAGFGMNPVVSNPQTFSPSYSSNRDRPSAPVVEPPRPIQHKPITTTGDTRMNQDFTAMENVLKQTGSTTLKGGRRVITDYQCGDVTGQLIEINIDEPVLSTDELLSLAKASLPKQFTKQTLVRISGRLCHFYNFASSKFKTELTKMQKSMKKVKDPNKMDEYFDAIDTAVADLSVQASKAFSDLVISTVNNSIVLCMTSEKFVPLEIESSDMTELRDLWDSEVIAPFKKNSNYLAYIERIVKDAIDLLVEKLTIEEPSSSKNLQAVIKTLDMHTDVDMENLVAQLMSCSTTIETRQKILSKFRESVTDYTVASVPIDIYYMPQEQPDIIEVMGISQIHCLDPKRAGMLKIMKTQCTGTMQQVLLKKDLAGLPARMLYLKLSDTVNLSVHAGIDVKGNLTIGIPINV